MFPIRPMYLVTGWIALAVVTGVLCRWVFPEASVPAPLGWTALAVWWGVMGWILGRALKSASPLP